MTTAQTRHTTHGDQVRDHLSQVEQHNAAALDAAADLLFTAVRHGGLVHTGGAGHSLAAVAETFYRAGGLACVRPLYHPELLPLHGAAASTAAERRTGLAAQVLDTAGLGEHDVLVVFSTSGVNPYPVELATLARQAGRPVIAVTSPAVTAAAPRRAHSTLAEQADIVLDTLVVPGDASYPADRPVTAPLSTLANVLLWNLLLVRLTDRAAAEGVELPLWRSSNMPDGDRTNEDLAQHYRRRVPQL